MGIDIANSTPEQAMATDEMQDFGIGGDAGAWQSDRAFSTISRPRRLPNASSPITNGCVKTIPASSQPASAFSPARK